MSTQILEYQNNQLAKFGYVRDGIAGNYEVVRKMIRLVRDSVVLDKGFESLVKDVLAAKGLSSYSDTEDIFNALYDFIHDHVKYFQDQQGRTESIKDARTTLNDGWGDCDDHAILNATALAVLGYDPKFVIAKYDNDPESNFQHVYTVVYVNGERYVFDTTLEYGELNDEVETTGKQEIGVFDYADNVDGILGITNSLKDLVTGTKRNALSTLGTVSSFLPLGFIPAHALALGASMFSGSGMDNESLAELGSKTSGHLTDLIIQLNQGKIAIEVAQRYAKQYLANFYAKAEKTEDNGDSYIFIEKQILKKVNHIESYGIANSGLSGVSLNLSLMQIIGIGAFGLVAFYLLKKSS